MSPIKDNGIDIIRTQSPILRSTRVINSLQIIETIHERNGAEKYELIIQIRLVEIFGHVPFSATRLRRGIILNKQLCIKIFQEIIL